jgi:hypothetical protein
MMVANPQEVHDRFPHCGARTSHGGKCHQWPGWGTEHVGSGKCKLHGGATPVKHGRYSTIARSSIQQRLSELKAPDADPLDLVEDLYLLRALTIDYIQRYDDFTEALLAWHTSFLTEETARKPRQLLDVASASKLIVDCSRLIDTIHKIRAQQTISLETFKRLMEQMGITVARHVDADTCAIIERAWGEIRVDAGRLDRR